MIRNRINIVSLEVNRHPSSRRQRLHHILPIRAGWRFDRSRSIQAACLTTTLSPHPSTRFLFFGRPPLPVTDRPSASRLGHLGHRLRPHHSTPRHGRSPPTANQAPPAAQPSHGRPPRRAKSVTCIIGRRPRNRPPLPRDIRLSC